MYLFLELEILQQLPFKNDDVRQTFCYRKVRLLDSGNGRKKTLYVSEVIASVRNHIA
jgi:hypothetical protein